MSEFYNDCHELFSYNEKTGMLIRKVDAVGRWGKPHPKLKAKAGSVVGSLSNGYLAVRIKGIDYRVHRIIWLMQTGDLPKNCIDHINMDKSDNRWANLREASKSQNGFNRGKTKNNRSGYKGVTSSNNTANPYAARIWLNNKCIRLGNFSTAILAHEAYRLASVKYHGEFARVA